VCVTVTGLFGVESKEGELDECEGETQSVGDEDVRVVDGETVRDPNEGVDDHYDGEGAVEHLR